MPVKSQAMWIKTTRHVNNSPNVALSLYTGLRSARRLFRAVATKERRAGARERGQGGQAVLSRRTAYSTRLELSTFAAVLLQMRKNAMNRVGHGSGGHGE